MIKFKNGSSITEVKPLKKPTKSRVKKPNLYKVKMVKLLPTTNPNFNMLDKEEDLIKLFKDSKFIMILDSKEENIIGVVDHLSKFKIEDGFVCGDVLFYKNSYKNYEYKNAMVKINEYLEDTKSATIKEIVSITFKEKNK